ncbi:complement C1q tumor necrosis factor-related protein 7-like [Dreissena polymorpha]|uniref:complement C1q tumor necrosis factor-related protein 7-like n=1 Tax=Dreissena polymorpha TaxID=45954 RepID=UPI002263ED0A|nr:complement C1q tumor necrosis factor-related protein 7-like [Dreissena polymorpha]
MGKMSRWTTLTVAMVFVLSCVASLGLKGETCNSCCMGPPGAPGVHGNHGLPGTSGPEGSKGDRGEKGYPGEKGSYGPKGDLGEKGEKGRKGAKGQCGAAGKDGEKGMLGPMGAFGPKGDKGIKGEKCVPSPKIAFFVTRTSRFGPVQQDTNIEFDKIFLNEGQAFDSHSSQFVCKVNGTYLFHAHILSQEDKDAFVTIMLNEQPRIPMHGDHRSGFGVASNMAIFKLEAGDKVYLRLKKDSAISNDSSTFSGYLIHSD